MKEKRMRFWLGHFGEKKSRPSGKKSEIVEENDREGTKKREGKKAFFGSFCSRQKRVGPPEYRKWRRIHGLQLPLHPQQIIGWIVLLFCGSATFFVLIPALRPILREILSVVLGGLFLLHVLSHLAALLLDPADPELRAHKINFFVPEFDRARHAHVIENGRCHLCNIEISGPKTKHCSVCNKCVDQFDHHCKWLNHCIGSRNYTAFLVCVTTAVAASLLVVVVSVLEMVCYHVDPPFLTVFSDRRNETNPAWLPPDSVFLGTVSVLGLLSAVTSGLLLHLCLFHCYISLLGITTYEYIRNYRRNPSQGDAEIGLPADGCCRKKKEVMSNRMEIGSPANRCYYSCSRPPESGNRSGHERFCFHPEPRFSSPDESAKGKERNSERPIIRENADPEFVDKIIKPFLITLNEERNHPESKPTDSKSLTSECYQKMAESKTGCGKRDGEDLPRNPESGMETTGRKISCKNLQSLCPKVLLHHPDSGNSIRFKTNQIRPASADEEEVESDLRTAEDHPEEVTLEANALPELNESLKRLRDPADLKRLGDVLDLIDRPPESGSAGNKSNFRKPRKKLVPIGIRSPLLSPIRESGLSNPGSPRMDLVLPPTPVFARPFSPETSVIFLSNPNSPSDSSSSPSSSSTSSSSSSCNGEEDDEDVVTRPDPRRNGHRRREASLRTPHFPRKVYSVPGGGDRTFVLKSSAKAKSGKWIDLEIKK